MSHIEAETQTGVECQTVLVRLQLPIDDLIERGRGAVWYPNVSLSHGAVFVAAWHQDGMMVVAFHVEVARPSVTRSFALAPIRHTFMREVCVEVRPLAMVVVPSKSSAILFTLYEAINVVGILN